MLEAALQRRYSGAPEQFFTGGGAHTFANFASWEDTANPTVLEAFENSINLSFVRVMRDIVNYYIAADGIEVKRLLNDPDNPRRDEYLQRFVEADSRRFLYRYYRDYRGLKGEDLLDMLAGRVSATPRKLAAVYMTLHPHARIAELYKFLAAHLPQTRFTEEQLWDLYLELLAGPDVAVRPRLCRRRASDGIVAGALSAGPSRRVVGRGAGRQRIGAAGGLRVAAQRQHGRPRTRGSASSSNRTPSTGFTTTGARSGFRSAISCPRSAPRSAPPATGRRPWPS